MAKAMKQGLIARKRGMTQVFGADGNVVPVTVLEAGPCTVVQVKTRATDGYDALQLGFEPRKKKIPKPLAGHFKKGNVGAHRVLREVRLESVDGYQAGQTLTVELFKPGELVDVTGVTKGRGFQGGIKRHGWLGGEATHGSMFHRAPGSIGASSDPSRVFPGHRLPGRMGATQVTAPHLEVVRVVPEQHLLVVKGAVPGATGGLVLIRKSVKLAKAQQQATKKA
jgi:large subunit ribosomal protein L3